MISSKKIQKIIAIVCICLCFTNIVALAAGNDDWTEAKYTASATKENWKAWCERFDKTQSKPTKIVLTPGKDATQMNFCWYSYAFDLKTNFRLSESKKMLKPIKIQVNTTKATKGFYSNKAVATNLKPNTTYYYQYKILGLWTKVYSFTTRNPKEYEFIFVGDPQIGSSFDNIPKGETKKQGQLRGVCNDSFNWNSTLQAANKRASKASFIVSSGDQIQSRNLRNSKENYKTFCKNEMEYAGFLMPILLRSLPIATSIGNHDCLSANYSYHFNNPNSHTGLGETYAGQDYYFNYGNTIFIMLNTNNPNVKEHETFINKALDSNKNAKWRIVTMHQDIFGSGEHSNEEDVIALRKGLLPIFRKNKINLVLTGHDHTYARAFIKNTDTSYDTACAYKQNIEKYNTISSNTIKYKTEDGILFITANSSSGSKYYKLVPIPQKYIEVRSQENQFAYTTIKVNDTSLQIDTYYTQSGKKVDKTIVITR